jgi:aminobenzoyl-glutamate transport protein
MSKQQTSVEDASKRLGPFLRGIERVGNKLPHPFFLFLYIAIFIAVISSIVSLTGATTTDPLTGDMVPIRGLLSGEGIVYMLTTAIENFITFPPLGLIITVMLGIGLAERVGFMETFMRSTVMAAPKSLITFIVVIVSLMGNLASDSASVILPPLAAAAFLAAGRNPLAGFAASYAAVVAGFSANIVPAGTDVLLSGITTSAAHIVDPDVMVSAVSNYYFMATSTVVLAVVITFVCQRFVEPRLGAYTGTAPEMTDAPISREQRRGLVVAAITAAVFLALLATAVLLPGSTLRGEDGGILRSPFMSSLPVFIMLFFVAIAVAYGTTAKTLTSMADVPTMMTAAVKDLVPFIIVIFTAAQAIAWFNWSQLGLLIANGGAEFLATTGLGGIGGLMIFSLFVTIPALLLASGSALWTLLAPIFVPMFMLSGVDPAYVQAAFRITDSATNPLVPMNPMLPVILGLLQRWDTKAGLGTLFSLVIPFTIAIWVVWLLLFLVWGLLGLPVGPGHGLAY